MLARVQLTVRQRAGDRRVDERVRVSQQHRAHPERIVDVDVAVEIVEFRSFGSCKEERMRSHPQAEVAADAARQLPRGPLERFRRAAQPVLAFDPHRTFLWQPAASRGRADAIAEGSRPRLRSRRARTRCRAGLS